jgi:hypothetical protein
MAAGSSARSASSTCRRRSGSPTTSRRRDHFPRTDEVALLLGGDVDGRLQQALGPDSGLGEDRQQIVERLPRLRLDVSWGDNPTGLVERAGAGREDERAGGCDTRVVVRDVLEERGGIDPLGPGHSAWRSPSVPIAIKGLAEGRNQRRTDSS